MELVILGFLMIRALSQYEIKKALNKNLSPYYSPSLGSIQSTLKKLLLSGHIVCETGVDHGRKKNSYTITKEGKCYFHTLMESDFTDNKFDSDSGSRLFFLGLLAEDEQYRVVKKIIHFLDEKLAVFSSEKVNVSQLVVNDAYSKIVNYQVKSLDLGYALYLEARRFYHGLLNEMEMEK